MRPEAHPEVRAAALAGKSLHARAHRFRLQPHEVQAETRAGRPARALVADAIEGLEDARALRLGDSRPSIEHLEHDTSPELPHADEDRLRSRSRGIDGRVLARVLHQVR